MLSITSFKDNSKGLADKIGASQDEYRKLEIEIRNLEAELQKIKKEQLDKEEILSNSQKELNDFMTQIREKENRKSIVEQQIGFKKQNLENLDHSLHSYQEQKTELEGKSSSTSSKIKEAVERQDVLADELNQADIELKKVRDVYNQTRDKFDARSRYKQELQHKIFENEKQIAITSNSIESFERELAQMQIDLEEHSEGKKSFTSEIKTTENSIQLIEKELEVLLQKEQKRKEEKEACILHMESLTSELNVINRKLDSKQNEHDLLQSMIDSYEGFPASLKFLSQNWKSKAPILSDVLDVEDDYKGVIEQYLESYLNFFLVQNLNEAKVAINILKESQKGKAHFFLLDQVKALEPNKRNLPNMIAANHVVHVDQKFKMLINYLLHDVYIYTGNDLDELNNNALDELTILSKQGTYIKKKYSISGGSVGLFEGKKIGRKKNLEKLQKILIELGKKRDVLEEKEIRLREKIDLLNRSDEESQIGTNNSKLKILEQTKIQQLTKLEAYEENYSTVIQKSETIKNEIKNKLDKKKEDTFALEALKKEFEDFENVKESSSSLEDLSLSLSKTSEAYNHANIDFLRQQNLVASLTQEAEYANNRLEEFTKRIEDGASKKRIEADLLDQLKEELTSLDKYLKDNYEIKVSKTSQLNEVEQKYFNARNIITEREDILRNHNRQLNQLQVSINTMKEEYSSVKFKIDAVAERLRIEFQLELSDIKDVDLDESLHVDQLNEKVERLRNRLNNFGEINPMAVEAYDEMKIRYEDIQKQKADIESAQESLEQTIKEIEETATTHFMEAFEKVRESFIEVFRSLFTEDDNCDLILLNPENPLDSNIEIIAKPKGKRPKSLSQLSGGEKTLTATALLFALYLLKPAPFCIFDEVDAPLDDANIQKFNRIIKKFSEKSQFIIVTHNKSTMAEVDILYGVYMQEQGVSGVTAVDFREQKHNPIMEALN